MTRPVIAASARRVATETAVHVVVVPRTGARTVVDVHPAGTAPTAHPVRASVRRGPMARTVVGSASVRTAPAGSGAGRRGPAVRAVVPARVHPGAMVLVVSLRVETLLGAMLLVGEAPVETRLETRRGVTVLVVTPHAATPHVAMGAVVRIVLARARRRGVLRVPVAHPAGGPAPARRPSGRIGTIGSRGFRRPRSPKRSRHATSLRRRGTS